MPTPPVLLALRGISKRFGAVQALLDVDLEIHAGEVVAVVGGNGAGKSTLLKVISGAGPADEGVIEWQGRTVRISRPPDARELGIAAAYQDLSLCENIDVIGNLFLGREISRLGFLDEVRMEQQARELLSTLSLHIPDLRVPVASLSAGHRRGIAICRCLLGDPRLLLLDEPTAAMSVQQSVQVLDLIERLRERGVGVLLISHNLGDVKAVADRAAVLRLGHNNGFFDVPTTSQEQIVSSITGATDNAVIQRATPEWQL